MKADTLSRWALPILILLAVVVRWPSFLPSVINHDESTYIIIGNGLLHGQAYLVDSYDTKPVGIFLVYALLNALAGGSIFGIRLLATIWLAFTAYLLFRLGLRAGGHHRVGWAAGISYVLMASIYTHYGISPNTEIFFNGFTVLAILLAWEAGNRIGLYVLAGLSLGAAFMIKYVSAGDAVALGGFLLASGLSNGDWKNAVFRRCAPLTLASFVPFVLVYAYYAQIGQLDNFFFYTFEVTSRYPVETEWWRQLKYMGDFLLRFAPLVIFALFALWEYRREDRSLQYFCLLWFAADTAILLLPGKFFGHYQVHLMPALALLAATWFHPARKCPRILKQMAPKWSYALLGLLILGLGVGLFSYYAPKADYPRQIAKELQQRMDPGDRVYTGNYHHIVCHLLGQPSLTPYVHSSLLYYAHHRRALDIDLAKESALILAENPRYILLREEHEENILTQRIKEKYTVADTLAEQVLLFEKR
ncbi:MAG: glycosyltransferase family 39 protein [Lewinellaceae bacterium]|nr:glycosyltransferase family 39 protein [Phaeodactylibacter sp.]MCB9038921.1 glycosyltransferase family 39 protein [Lewinellaceae bacterium]